MKLKNQTFIIQRLVEQGDLKNALMQLRQLAPGGGGEVQSATVN